jgi:Protein of unknown function DUF2617
MTVHQLDIPPRDVSAGALGLLLGAPAPVPLAELALRDHRGGALLLGVLGASHVVTATVPGHRLTEEVSCDAISAGGTALPRQMATTGYEITSSTTTVPRTELDATAERLRTRAERDPAWLCGSFPGSGSALTALTGRALPEGGWTWETWHLYPAAAGGEVVLTRSRWTP